MEGDYLNMGKWCGWKRKYMALLMAVAMLVSMVPYWGKPVEVKAATKAYSLDEIKNELLPAGKYWNRGGVSDKPCPRHERGTQSTCNCFNGAWQCAGFCWKMASLAYGLSESKVAGNYTKRYNLNGLKAGDIIRYKSHSIFVTSVKGENIKFCDCNSDYHCVIRWNVSTTKSYISSYLVHVWSASYALGGNVAPEPTPFKLTVTTSSSNITNESAKISVSLDKEVKVQEWGYFIGTSENDVKAIDGAKTSNLKPAKGYVSVGSNKSTKSLSATIKKISDNDLSPDKNYYYKVVVKAENKWFQSTINKDKKQGWFKTKNDPPGKTTLKLTSAKDIGVGGTATLSWDKASNTKSYIIKLFDSNNNVVWEKTGIKELGYKIPDSKLKTPGKYTVKLYTANKTSSTTLCKGTPSIIVHKNIRVTFADTVTNKKIEEQKNIVYGGSAKEPNKPVHEGYTFKNWDKSFTNIKSDSDIVVNAEYTANKYTVKFVDGITKEVLETKKVSYGTKLSESDYPAVKEHDFHDFTGWSESEYVVKAETHVIEAIYEWNSQYDLETKIESVNRARLDSNKEATDGYNVVVKVQAKTGQTKTTNGRIIVALKTKNGRLLIETESAAFVLYPNTSKQIEVFVPLMELASETEVYVVNSYNSAGIISRVVKDTNLTLSANNDQWQWTSATAKPVVGENGVIAIDDSQNYVSYDLQTVETKDSLATSLSGYTLKNKDWKENTSSGTIEYVKSWPKLGDVAGIASKGTESQASRYNNTKTAPVGKYLYDTYNKTPKTEYENATTRVRILSEVVNGAIYYHWCQGKTHSHLDYNAGYKKLWADLTSGNKYYTFHSFYANASNDTKIQATYHYNTKLEKELYVWAMNKVTSTSYIDQCQDTQYWAKRLPVYKQTWTQDTMKYTYTKTTIKSVPRDDSNDYPRETSSTAKPVIQNNVTLNGSTKTTVINKKQWYAYKTSKEVENPDLNIYDIDVKVACTDEQKEEYKDKELTVYVYKYDQVADYTTEYIGTARINDNGNISIPNAQMREECSEKTGDFTIAVALPNETGALVVGTIEALKPKYTVKFYDFDRETVVYEEKVEQGDTVEAPDAELLTVPEGKRFAGWDQSTVGVNSDLNVYPTSETITCVVTFVNWFDQSVEMKEIQYGEDIFSYLPILSGNDEIDLSWDLSSCDIISETTYEEVDGVQQEVRQDKYVVKKNTVITAISTKKQYETRFLGIEYAEENKEELEDIINKNLENNIEQEESEQGEEQEISDVDYINENEKEESDIIFLDAQDEDYILIDTSEYEDRFNIPIEVEETPNIIFYGWRNLSTGEMLEDTTVKENAVYYPVYIYEETVSAPYASVHTGEYSDNQTVILSCDTEGATIFYTTDGSDPCNSETAIEYISPINVTKSCAIRFMACKMSMNDSETISELYAMNTSSNPVNYYIVTIDDNGVYRDNNTCYQMLVKEGSRLNSIDGEIYGYTYEGLYYDENYSEPFGSDIVDESMTLYAKYTPKKYTATFYYDSEKTQKLREDTVNYLDSATSPTFDVPDGYIFLGWDSDEYLQMTENCDIVARICHESQYATVSINRTKPLSIQKGDSRTIAVTITPGNLSGTELMWESSDVTVAYVDENGLVTGVGVGEADITVTVVDTGESSTLRVKVNPNTDETLALGSRSSLDIDSNGYLRRIKAGANTVAEIKDSFINEGLKFYGINGAELNDTDKVGTGTVIRFMDEEDNILDEMTVIMTGDYDGDGEIKNKDVAMLSQYLIDKKEADIYQMLAIDVNGDGNVNVRDAAMLSRYLVGKEEIR